MASDGPRGVYAASSPCGMGSIPCKRARGHRAVSELLELARQMVGVVGIVHTKRMFSGHAFYLEGVVVAFVAQEVLYLKTDPLTTPRFIERGLAPFSFERDGKRVSLSYYTAPEEVLEDEEAAREWIGEALAAAKRQQQRKG
jgi:DNA transformation protein and related proteins